ncbi:hypothetical protein [Pseudonocardia sp. HH130630-07]|uniref:hypothetical protein n=1 Tax=Pseudonocardia sp. HH130630-07 TaxID=1690815 RepID=UPI0008150F39|nr:hypothetical protein [Pseudonocardia sp. HH130630-07]ANY08352.1 hypothetical protein AFB00_21065 [Pseudonocardia sp. HH130630-07]
MLPATTRVRRDAARFLAFLLVLFTVLGCWTWVSGDPARPQARAAADAVGSMAGLRYRAVAVDPTGLTTTADVEITADGTARGVLVREFGARAEFTVADGTSRFRGNREWWLSENPEAADALADELLRDPAPSETGMPPVAGLTPADLARRIVGATSWNDGAPGAPGTGGVTADTTVVDGRSGRLLRTSDGGFAVLDGTEVLALGTGAPAPGAAGGGPADPGGPGAGAAEPGVPGAGAADPGAPGTGPTASDSDRAGSGGSGSGTATGAGDAADPDPSWVDGWRETYKAIAPLTVEETEAMQDLATDLRRPGAPTADFRRLVTQAAITPQRQREVTELLDALLSLIEIDPRRNDDDPRKKRGRFDFSTPQKRQARAGVMLQQILDAKMFPAFSILALSGRFTTPETLNRLADDLREAGNRAPIETAARRILEGHLVTLETPANGSDIDLQDLTVEENQQHKGLTTASDKSLRATLKTLIRQTRVTLDPDTGPRNVWVIRIAGGPHVFTDPADFFEHLNGPGIGLYDLLNTPDPELGGRRPADFLDLIVIETFAGMSPGDTMITSAARTPDQLRPGGQDPPADPAAPAPPEPSTGPSGPAGSALPEPSADASDSAGAAAPEVRASAAAPGDTGSDSAAPDGTAPGGATAPSTDPVRRAAAPFDVPGSGRVARGPLSGAPDPRATAPGGIDLGSVTLRYLSDGTAGTGTRYAFSARPGAAPATGTADTALRASDAFFVWLALPRSSFWVNLNPDQPDTITDPQLGTTDVGRTMLESDLRLKQALARLTDPRTPGGAAFWRAPGALDLVRYCNTVRVWIVPGEARVRDAGDAVEVLDAPLRVQLERSTVTAPGPCEPAPPEVTDRQESALRARLLPALQRQVDDDPAFAELRQIHSARVVAEWYRARSATRPTEFASVVDSGDAARWASAEPWSPREIFERYRTSFREGEYPPAEIGLEGGRWLVSWGGIDLSAVPVRTDDRPDPVVPVAAVDRPVNAPDGTVWLGSVTEDPPPPRAPAGAGPPPWTWALPVAAGILVLVTTGWRRRHRRSAGRGRA